jgi:hypothetical protein
VTKVRGFRNLYSSRNIRLSQQKNKRWVEHIAHMVDMRNTNKILFGKPEKRLLAKTLLFERILLK